jgi:hypothetical protein
MGAEANVTIKGGRSIVTVSGVGGFNKGLTGKPSHRPPALVRTRQQKSAEMVK